MKHPTLKSLCLLGFLKILLCNGLHLMAQTIDLSIETSGSLGNIVFDSENNKIINFSIGNFEPVKVADLNIDISYPLGFEHWQELVFSQDIFFRFSPNNKLIKYMRILGECFITKTAIDSDNYFYILCQSNSDSLLIGDSLVIGKDFINSFLLIKLNQDLELQKIISFKNPGAINTQLIIEKNRLYFTSIFYDSVSINDKVVFGSPRRLSHAHDAYIACLNLSLDTCHYLTAFVGLGYNDIEQLEITSSNELIFFGGTKASKFTIGLDSFDFSKPTGPRWFIGQFDQVGKLNWFRSGIEQADHQFRKVKKLANGNFLIAGNFGGRQVEFFSTVLENTNYNKWDSYMIEINDEGELVFIKHFKYNGNFRVVDFEFSKDKAPILSAFINDTLITDNGKVYVTKTQSDHMIIPLNSDYSLNNYLYFTAERDAFVVKFIKSENNLLQYLLLYIGKYLYDHTGKVIDSSENATGKYVLISDDRNFTNISGYTYTHLDFRFYPNPATDLLHFELTESNDPLQASYSIADVYGRKLIEGLLPSSTQAIGIHKLQNGLYYLILNIKGMTTAVRRLVKI